MGLTFLPRPQPRPRKRSRPATDIDGEHSCMQKKKRRLRLFLITSRLSPQFSHPATNIVDRGSSKIAVWAKQRSLGRNLLRKAAILNHIRHRNLCARASGEGPGQAFIEQEREQKELALAKLEFNHGNVDTYTRPVTGRRDGQVSEYRSPNEAYAHLLPTAQIPRREYIPLPPSPLGLSNYDAFDTDDDVHDRYAQFDEEDEDGDDGSSIQLFGQEEDPNDVPFTPSVVTATSPSTLQTTVSHLPNTPLPPMQLDMDILDHGEPVIGDYDQVEQGAEAVWPSRTGNSTHRRLDITKLRRHPRDRPIQTRRLVRNITQIPTDNVETTFNLGLAELQSIDVSHSRVSKLLPHLPTYMYITELYVFVLYTCFRTASCVAESRCCPDISRPRWHSCVAESRGV
ncbi:hypothetical protein IQ06DRAFT_210544 [Phaeosphaeriaceae sp. SRC1lsM3a]|nr:hypothetical protein IQ06DRAFT_210544 [Stagonospora sp. SRC1lsM3a]